MISGNFGVGGSHEYWGMHVQHLSVIIALNALTFTVNMHARFEATRRTKVDKTQCHSDK